MSPVDKLAEIEQKQPAAQPQSAKPVAGSGAAPVAKTSQERKEEIVKRVIDQLSTYDNPDDDRVRAVIRGPVEVLAPNMLKAEKMALEKEIFDSMINLGPLQPLVDDPTISEIMVNGPADVYIERKGCIEKSGITFADEEEARKLVNRIVEKVGRHCDEATPYVDARLADGSRVNCVIPPVAAEGTTITIRKFAARAFQVEDLIKIGTVTPPAAAFLEAAVQGKCNILVAGGTGAGKTTMLNILSDFIPDNERIITIEDTLELQLRQAHVVPLEARPSNTEGQGAVTIRQLLVNALRMRPDRIIVGECRSVEVMDMLQAMNTGHEGSLTTVHANSAIDSLKRIEMMCTMASENGDVPISVIREQVASALDLVVYIKRHFNGQRKITEILEIDGIESGNYKRQPVFACPNQSDPDSPLLATGIRPKVLSKLRGLEVPVDDGWFRESVEGRKW